MPSALFFLLRIALALQSLCGSIQILGSLFLFFWKMHWDFDRDYFESTNVFGQNDHFSNINSSDPQTQDIFPYLCLQFLPSILDNLPYSFISLVKFTCKYFIFFNAVINSIYLLLFQVVHCWCIEMHLLQVYFCIYNFTELIYQF